MTDDVVLPKTEFTEKADEMIDMLKFCPPRGIRVTSAMKDIERQPLLFSPIPFSPEDVEIIDDEFVKIFPKKRDTDFNTMIDVKLCEEGAYREVLAQKLRFDIYHRGYRMNFAVINYLIGSEKFQTLNVRMQYPKFRPFLLKKEDSKMAYPLFYAAIDITKPFIVKTCLRYGIEI